MQNQTGPSYFCNVCHFWIHRDCALLPNKITLKKHHSDRHILILTYSLAQAFPVDCAICSEEMRWRVGYICTSCEYAAHCNCVTSDPEIFSPALTEDNSLVHLPMADEQTSLVRYLLEKTTSSESTGKEEEEDPILAKKLFKMHQEHPLVYHDHSSLYIKDDDNQKHHWCNGCIRPISPPFYRCPECSDFFLHSHCANLSWDFWPQIFRHGRQHFFLTKNYDDKLLSSFRCTVCNLICNGFLYKAYTNYNYTEEDLDVECTFLPNFITHEAHPKSHLLFLVNAYVMFSKPYYRCECCGENLSAQKCYDCTVCPRFQLHIHCAKLPKTVIHKFDKHPLKLKFTRSSSELLPTTELDDEHFCEICEENINTKLWYYGCDECNNWFHINCIPSVGKLSKIKFGGTIRVPGHDCPLTSIRLITEYSHRCGICKNIIEGFKDEIAFECSKCDFRVHYSCAKRPFDNFRWSN